MKTIAQISVIGGLAVLLVGGFLVENFYARPLAEPMNVQMPETQEAAPAGAAVEHETPAEKPETCGQTGVMRVLFTGADFSVGVSPLGADAVRIVKVDFDNKKIVAVAFPRDMLLKTPALADLNIAESRLGLAYHYRKEATRGEEKYRITKATELLAQTLYDNYAYPTEREGYYFFTLQLDQVGEMINTIGGVPVDLPESITTEHEITFPAGQQTLDGKLSSEYARALMPGGDAARLERQNLFIKALQAKVLSAGVLLKVPELYNQFDKAIVTDLSPKQIESLACMAKEIPQEQIVFHEIGVENGLVTVGDDGALIPDAEKIKAALQDWFGE